MANIVGDIAIQVGADIGPLVRDLGKAQGAVSGFGKTAKSSADGGMRAFGLSATALAAGVVAAGSAMAVMTKQSLDNIDAISKQAKVAGLAVASFQAMAMVAEEAGIESEALSKILVKMQDNINGLRTGTTAQVDAFARLGVSVSDLQGLNADEQFGVIAEALGSITDPAAKTAAALDVFGKAGADALNMVTGYTAAVADAAKFQQEFGLAVSDLDAANVEAANDAMGRLGMATEGLGTALATNLAPAITATAEALTSWITGLTGAQAALDELLGNSDRAIAILGPELAEALLQSKGTILENIDVISDLRLAYDSLSRDVSVAVNAMAGDISYLLELGFNDLALELSNVSDEMTTLQGDFDAGRIGADQFDTAMADAITRAQELLAEANAIDGVDMSGAVAQVGVLASALAIARDVAAALRSALPGSVPDSATTFAPGPTTATDLAYENPLTLSASPRPKSAPSSIDFGLPDIGGGGGGGGGGGESLQDRLAKMQEEFATESELLQEQYDAQLAQLEEFRNAKIMSEQEFNELEAKVKEEHEKRLTEIEAAEREARLSSMAGAFGDLASLMQSGNEKLFKIGKAAAIAEATISGYQAAVDAWQKGMKIGGPPLAAAYTAASLVKTGGLIASIASQSSNGGGGGGTSSGGSSGTSTAPAPATQYFTIDAPGMDIGALVEGLNQATAAGYRIQVNAA